MKTFVIYLNTTQSIDVEADGIVTLSGGLIALSTKSGNVAIFVAEKIIGIVEKASVKADNR